MPKKSDIGLLAEVRPTPIPISDWNSHSWLFGVFCIAIKCLKWVKKKQNTWARYLRVSRSRSSAPPVSSRTTTSTNTSSNNTANVRRKTVEAKEQHLVVAYLCPYSLPRGLPRSHLCSSQCFVPRGPETEETRPTRINAPRSAASRSCRWYFKAVSVPSS